MNKNRKFPKIYRFITENDSWRQLLIGFVSSFVFLALAVVCMNTYKNYQEKLLQDSERAQINKEISLWNPILQKYKGYRDGYFQIALLEYQLKDFEKARNYLQKTLILDPNFEEARKLEKILNSRK